MDDADDLSMTGASSRTHGVYYDVSYDRSLYPPGSGCVGPRGTVVAYDETIDANSSGALDFASLRLSLTLHRIDVSGGGRIDPNNLPLEKTAWGGCAPVYPNNFVRVNNIVSVGSCLAFPSLLHFCKFEIARFQGMKTC